MAYRAEAYDFALFEARYDNTVPVREPRREQRREKLNNVVELPGIERDTEKRARPKRHPVKAILALISFAAFVCLASAMVYSQEQMAMLTEQINTASQTLAESRSVEVQLNMQAAQKMNGAQVEEYAATKLGMSKVGTGQVTYVNVARQEKGVVVQSTDGGSTLDKLLHKFKELFY